MQSASPTKSVSLLVRLSELNNHWRTKENKAHVTLFICSSLGPIGQGTVCGPSFEA